MKCCRLRINYVLRLAKIFSILYSGRQQNHVDVKENIWVWWFTSLWPSFMSVYFSLFISRLCVCVCVCVRACVCVYCSTTVLHLATSSSCILFVPFSSLVVFAMYSSRWRHHLKLSPKGFLIIIITIYFSRAVHVMCEHYIKLHSVYKWVKIEWKSAVRIVFVFEFCFTLTPSVFHSALVLLQANTLNVAFNSHNKALLTIMMSNNVSIFGCLRLIQIFHVIVYGSVRFVCWQIESVCWIVTSINPKCCWSICIVLCTPRCIVWTREHSLPNKFSVVQSVCVWFKFSIKQVRC